MKLFDLFLKKNIACLLLLFTLVSNSNATETLKTGHMLYSSLDASPKDIKTSLSLWMAEVGSQIGLNVDSNFYTSIESLKRDMESGKIDYMIIKSIDAVKYFNYEELIEGYAPTRQNNHTHNKLILVMKKNSGINKIEDFKDKRLGLYKNNITDKFFIDTLLLRKKLPEYLTYFSKVTEYKKRSQILLNLFFNQIDVAIVTQGTLDLVSEMNPQVSNSIHILYEKPIHLGVAGFFSKSADEKLVKRFYEGVGKISNSERAKQILTLFKADNLAKTDKQNLRDLDTFYKEYLALKKRNDLK